MPSRDFYSAASTVIPVLLLIITLQTGVLRRYRHYRPESATRARWDRWRNLPPRRLEGIGPVGIALLATLLRAVVAPSRCENTVVLVGNLGLTMLAEVTSLIGLAYYPVGTWGRVLGVFTWIGLGMLIMEAFVGLVVVILSETETSDTLPPA